MQILPVQNNLRTTIMAGLYIHIPFCHSKCAYCDFFSVAHSAFTDAYLETLNREYDLRKEEITEPFSTIYIGGGTPSSIGINHLENILKWIPYEAAGEFTIEVNPEDVTPDMCRFLADSPINRVSMGVQSLDDNQLKFIGRRHSSLQAIDAYHDLRNAGIDNISLDLIFGLPNQSFPSWQQTLKKTLALKPDHLSAYSLMLEKGTRLWAMKQNGKFTETDDETISRMYDHLCDATATEGFTHYEISNFARNGKKSLHNSSYWNLTPYLGLGTGAHSFDGTMRRYNPWKIKDYISSKGRITQTDFETHTERANDYIMIRLRTAEGLSLRHCSARFGTQFTETIMKEAKKEIAHGNLILTNESLIIPEHKWLVSDPIIANLLL